MVEDILDMIGGRSTIKDATELFYDKVLQDDSLRQFFEGVDMVHLRSRQTMFISMLLGGRVHTGKNIHDAHARSRDHGLKDVHFDLFLKHFRAALEEVGVKPENVEKIMKRLESKCLGDLCVGLARSCDFRTRLAPMVGVSLCVVIPRSR